VDLLYERSDEARLYEIKAAARFRPEMTKPLEKVARYWDRQTRTTLIYQGEEERLAGKTMLRNWQDLKWRRKG